MSDKEAKLGPVGQCHLTFMLGNKCFTGKLIVLKDLGWKLVLGPNWQSNYTIDYNWIVNGH